MSDFVINRSVGIPGPPGPPGPPGSADAQTLKGAPLTTPTVAGTTIGYDTTGAASWQRQGHVNALFFGADPTGITASDNAWDQAVAAAGLVGGITGGTVLWPAGTYRFTSRKTLAHASAAGGYRTGIKIKGEGGGQSYSSSATTLLLAIDDTRAYGCTLSAATGGFVTLTAAVGTFVPSDFDCSVALWGWPTETNNGRNFIVVGVSSDGSQLTIYAPAFAAGTFFSAESGGSVCVGHVGFDNRTGDCVFEDVRIVVAAGHKLTAAIDWTESNQTGHVAVTKFQLHRVFMGTADYSTSRQRYAIRVGRSIATTLGAASYDPQNCDYLELTQSQFWQGDEALVGVLQRTAQSRSNIAIGCSFIYAPAMIWASSGTQWDLVSCSLGGNAPIKFNAELLVLGSGPPSTVFGCSSEGATSLGRFNALVNFHGGNFTMSAANMRRDQVLCEVSNNQTCAFWGSQIVTSDVTGASVYATSTSAFETSINFHACSLPVSARAFEPHYLPSSRKGPYVLHDGDVLTFTVDGVTKTCTLHTTGSAGVPIDLDGSRRWRFGVSGTTILEAQGWEIAQLIEEQIPGLAAIPYSDQSQIRIYSVSSVGGSVIATYPLGASDPNHKFEWAAGAFFNSALTQCSIDTSGYVAPGTNNASAFWGTTYYDPTTKTRRAGASGYVRTGTATTGATASLSGISGISSGVVARHNVRGTATILSGQTSVTVTLTIAETDANYTIIPACTAAVAVAASVRTKTTTTFQLVAASTVGADTAYDWVMVG